LQCPRCKGSLLHEGPVDQATCSNCGFSGASSLLEELTHIQYLLGELAGWQEIAPAVGERLRIRYLRRREELEVALGLRLPPFDPEEAAQARWELLCLEELIEEVTHWVESGWARPEPAQELIERSSMRAEELRHRLAACSELAAPPFDRRPQDTLKMLGHLREALDDLHAQGGLVDEAAYAAATAELVAEQEELEIELGLRPSTQIRTGTLELPKEAPAELEPLPETPPRRPREPLTWDRLWQTLLSERTLNAMLFLGVFLLFASAITLVVFNWDRFPPLVQVIFIAAFTLTFYSAGWFVRARMGLRSSGIALTAIGSLLVPIDFYTIYLSGGFPHEAWPQVWLGASILCFVAYLFTALRIQAQFFGYLVGSAAGSLLCAAMQVIGVHTDWWSAALSILALAVALSADRLCSERVHDSRLHSPFSILYRPLWHMAMTAVTAIMPLTLGWYATGRIEGQTFRLALAVDWWLGSALYGLAAARFHSRSPSTLRPFDFAQGKLRSGQASLRTGLGFAAAMTAPIALYLSQALAFDQLGIRPAWHALGWAVLAPGYLALGWVLLTHRNDPVDQAHGRTATGWGIGLMILSAIWSLTDMSVAAVTHTVLIAAVVLAVGLWRRPAFLPFASLLSLSAMTAGMASRDFVLGQLALGWALLAILHLTAAVALKRAPSFATPVYAAGCACSGLSLLPPLLGNNQGLLTYALGNWIALAAWSAWLAYGDDHPGLKALLRRAGPFQRSLFHWATVVPLPVFLWLAWTLNDRPADARLGLALMFLAWGCVAIGRWWIAKRMENGVKRHSPFSIRYPQSAWYVVGCLCSLISPLITYVFWDQALLSAALLAAAALYFLSAWVFRQQWWLIPAGVILPLGYISALDWLDLAFDPMGTAFALVPAVYLLGGLVLERFQRVERSFMRPLYGVAHGLAAGAVVWGFVPLWNRLVWGVPWTDAARLWAAGGQLILGVTYGLAAWFFKQERWGHVAAWLGVIAGGFIAAVYSRGRGSSAAEAALLAAVYVLAERGLHAARNKFRYSDGFCRAWPLYRRPLLVAGWAVSGGAILLALVRNLVLLGGGRVREIWAIVALLIVTALYALSARLFRRPLFLWLAAVLVIAPWTLLTHLNWFLWPEPPPLPRYALAWALLAWAQMLVGLLLDARAGLAYGRPLRVTAHLLLPFALLWGIADADTSSLTYGLGVAFYLLAVVVDHRRLTGLIRSRFLYPAAGLVPVWAVYLLARLVPSARHEHFGLMLLAFAPLGLVAGQLLRRMDPADELPAYLAGCGCALVGTMLVAHERPLLTAALLFDALLSIASARLFRQPLWVYPAAALTPMALLLALAEAGVDPNRRGWALIGLGAVYLGLAWILRRLRRHDYATPVLAAVYVLIALGLPPSSHDQIGSFWGYGAAALLYALSAIWLRQPLFLTPAAALSTVPCAVALIRSPLAEINYGLALWPGIAASLLLARLLDTRPGFEPNDAPQAFPWSEPERWVEAVGQRLLNWWGLPWYVLGYVTALVSAFLSLNNAPRLTLTLALTAGVYTLATLRFRLRGWLLLAAVTGQAAALAAIDTIGWLDYPAWAALAFLPVTVATALLGLLIERKRGEGSPSEGGWRGAISGWSRPLYALLVVDLLVAQWIALPDSGPGIVISLVHGLLVALLATAWVQPLLPYVAETLGLLALLQSFNKVEATLTDLPVALALLALGYGLVGYSLGYAHRHSLFAIRRSSWRVWEKPLQRAGLLISTAVLGLTVTLGVDIIGLVIRAFLGLPFPEVADVPTLQMTVGVLAITGLLYLAAALVERWTWLGYGAVALLLSAWSLEWFFIWGMRETQWYAVPAGIYLLGVGCLEWRQDRKTLARWIDRAGLLLLLFSSFWQSMTATNGWPYALLMGAEGLAITWWGSARRQRRFLYFGVAGVVVDVVGQLIEPLLSANRWIVFGVAGLILVTIAVLVERQLEAVMRLSRELRERLEEWE
jgi:hypothetical protein